MECLICPSVASGHRQQAESLGPHLTPPSTTIPGVIWLSDGAFSSFPASAEVLTCEKVVSGQMTLAIVTVLKLLIVLIGVGFGAALLLLWRSK